MSSSVPGISKKLNSEELARYSRHILLDEIGVAGQEALKNSRVLVVGAGGLGSPVAMYLAAAGVGAMGLADFDVVELHNLQRQIIHATSEIDAKKTLSAQKRIQEINPNVRLEIHEEGVQAHNALDLFCKYDIIVDGSDNFSTRYLNTDAAYFAKKPLVYGSIFKFEGQVSLFHPAQEGPCYRCLFPEPPPPGSVPSCGEAGVFGALCGVIGSLQALETVKYITGIGEPLIGSLLVSNTLNMSFRRLKLKKDPSCPLCSEQATIRKIDPLTYQYACEIPEDPTTMETNYPIEIDINETKRLLDETEAMLVDVREPFEFDICSIDGSLKIPMNSIPSNLDRLPKDKHILFHCHHGGRSMNVVKYLRQNGYENTTNVAGGIDAWAIEIDPSLQRY
ncbi:MAG: molybdopterin-synthase adenylyltransferase MoeB [Verrucomicrobiota bacterium]